MVKFLGCILFAVSAMAQGVQAPQAEGIELFRGINLGNALEAPFEGAWGVVPREEFFDLIAQAGFDTVRIPIRWSAHALRFPPYTISEEFFSRVDWAIQNALERGLYVIINMHHYEEIFRDPAGERERFLELWRQIAARYAYYPGKLLFELLNEPHDALTPEYWNDLLQEALRVVRETNPERWIVIGPANWNHIRHLPTLRLLEDDRRIIVTFHYYEPFRFTHQGAEWVQGSAAWLGTRWTGSPSDRQVIQEDLDFAVRWALAQARPLFLGEFGAYSRADVESRVRWTAFVAREAEKRGIPWAYWEFCAGFGVYDVAKGVWRMELLRALIPESAD